MRGARMLATIAAALLVVGCGLQQDVASRPVDAGPGQGQAAPSLQGSLVGGGTFDLAAQRGHPVLVNFWASWCGPCHAEQADLNSAARRFAGRVTVVGVDVMESAAEVRGYEGAEKVPYPSLIDNDGSIGAAYNIPAPPTTVVVDANGKIAQTFYGSVASSALDDALTHVLR